MKDIMKTALKLLVICAVAGLCLAVTYGFTNPKIKQQQADAEKAGYLSLFPDTASFEEIAFDNAKFPGVTKAVRLMDGGKKSIGYCVLINTKGYKGSIELTVGFLQNGTLAGIRIGSNSETVGLGSKVAEPAYYMQYGGKNPPLSLGKDITAISGATVSSRAVLNGVNLAQKAFLSIVK